MKVPKYIRAKIIKRCTAQMTATSLQIEIEEWCCRNGIENQFNCSHVVLFEEPRTTAATYLEEIKKHNENR